LQVYVLHFIPAAIIYISPKINNSPVHHVHALRTAILPFIDHGWHGHALHARRISACYNCQCI